MARLHFTPLFVGLTGLCLTAGLAPAWQQSQAQENTSAATANADLQQALLGAWVLAGSPTAPTEPAADAEMKFWGMGYFSVTKRVAGTGEIAYHHVGTYTLDGDQCAETITHAIGETTHMIGETFKFRIAVDGDIYTQQGIGNPRTQQWRRLTTGAGSTAAEQPPADPYAEFTISPQASTEELLLFVDKARSIRPKLPPGKPLNMREYGLKMFGAIVEAADTIMTREITEEQLVKALSKKLEALAMLVSLDRSREPEVQAVIEQYANDPRPAIAALVIGQSLRAKASQLRAASEAQVQEISQELLSYVERFGVTRSTYPAIASVASGLGYSEHTELAAEFHEKIATFFRDSADESLQRYAERMLGTARRLRLLGNEIAVSGTLADGSEVNWEEYRGKVVLVDYWASWCGPCLAELPNMKKNVQRYGDRGFVILGINMDSTRAAFEKAVNQHDISWANIFEDQPGNTGWDAPMATKYGVSGIPTAILVDQQGKVVSLRARGAELDRRLEALLGSLSADSEDAESAAKDPEKP